MENKSRLLVAGGAIILILTFFFPLWSIDLNAPQYPEGLGIRIWLNEITGLKPNDLQSINGLNHYIGMKVIDPDAIPELKIMPYIIVFMILFGLLNAYLKSKKLIYVWIIIFLELFTFGMALVALAFSSKENPQLFHESSLHLNRTFGTINTIFLLT